MMKRTLMCVAVGLVLLTSACSQAGKPDPTIKPLAFADYAAPLYPNETPELRSLIMKYAEEYKVPPTLIQKVVIRESRHRPAAKNGPYYGLMQILPATARSMGFDGDAKDLLNADTNLKYAVKYLKGAYVVAEGNEQEAIMHYARGYYYAAKSKGLLKEAGLR